MLKIYKLLLLLGMLLSGLPGRAQLLNGYQFQAQAGTYVPLGAGATPLPALQADEAVVDNVPLGFVFVLGGRYFAKVGVSSNGWLGLWRSAITNPSPNSGFLMSGNGIEHTIAPCWSDLSGVGGSAQYQTSGTAPNRVFTMEWRNFRWDRLAPQAVVSFQARLFEGSNRIEFSYQPEAGSVSNTGALSAARAGLSVYNPGSSRHNVIALLDLSASPQPSTSSAPGTFVKPASGQQYSFTPSPNTLPTCEPALSQSVGRLGRTTARINWVFSNSWTGGAPRVHYGPRGFVLGSADDHLVAGMPGDSAQLTGLLPATDYEYLVETDCAPGTAPARTARSTFSTYTPSANDEANRAIWVPVLPVLRPSLLTPGFCQDASPSMPAAPGCPTPAGTVRDVWYTFRATETSHQVVVSGAGQGSTFVTELRDGYGPNSQSLDCSTGSTPTYGIGLTVGRVYFIRVYPLTYNTFQAYFELGVLPLDTPAPANDNCGNAPVLAVAPVPDGLPATVGTVRHATPSNLTPSGVAACALVGAGPSKDVFYRFVAPGAAVEVQLRPAFQAGVEVLSSCTTQPLSYQNCMVVPGGHLGRLPMTGLTPGATYYLRVYNQWESVLLVDATFRISVSAPPTTPANDDCAGALPLPVTARAVAGVSSSLLGATASALPPPPACYQTHGSTYTQPATARDMWYRFTATTATHVLQLRAGFHAVVEVFGGSASPCAGPGTAQPLACGLSYARDPNISLLTPTVPVQVLLPGLTVGGVYWVRVYPLRDVGTATRPDGDVSFELGLHTWEAPANDEPAGAIPLPISAFAEPCSAPIEFTLDGATPTVPVPNGTMWDQRDVWFSFVAPPARAGSMYSYVMVRVGTESGYIIHGGIQCFIGPTPGGAPLSSVYWAAGVGGYTPFIIPSFLVPGQTYYVRVYSSLPAPEPWGKFTLCLTAPLNDEPCDAYPLPLSASGQCLQPVRGTTLGATHSTTNPGLRLPLPNCSSPGDRTIDVWYRVVPTTPAFTLHSDDITVSLARLYQPAAAGSCSGALQLVGCQSRLGSTIQQLALGTVFFDNLTVGQPYYLAVSSQAPNLPTLGRFTLCAQASTTLPVRAGAGRQAITLWPNPVAAGEPLQVQLPTGQVPHTQVRVEWLSAVGQVLPELAPGRCQVTNGVVQVPTQGRPPGLYLLRLWLPDGQPLPVHRVVIE